MRNAYAGGALSRAPAASWLWCWSPRDGQTVPGARRPVRQSGRRERCRRQAQSAQIRLLRHGPRRRKMSGASTPLMQQYREIKSRHQDAILFFRMGEFYEMFYDDAETASRTLGLTLTARNNGGAADVPLAAVPVKAAADYVRRLVQQGYRVAICEQVEDPKSAKGIVRREVVETVTPGAALADDLLEGTRNNYVCALTPATGKGEPGTVAI